MRALTWLIRFILFLLLFGLALNNMAPTQLHLLFGAQLQAPLFALLLAAFIAGVAAGAMAMLPALLRARRPQAPGTLTPTPARHDDDGIPDGI